MLFISQPSPECGQRHDLGNYLIDQNRVLIDFFLLRLCPLGHFPLVRIQHFETKSVNLVGKRDNLKGQILGLEEDLEFWHKM